MRARTPGGAVAAVAASRIAWRLLEWPIGFFLWILSRSVVASLRVERQGTEPEGAAIHVIFHRHLPLLMVHHGRARRRIMMSAAPRMAPIARWARLLGLRLERGATGEHGREALDALENALFRGESVLLAVDGPAGPALRVKPGCVELARRTGAPIVPMGYGGPGTFEVPRRWDRLLLVVPFGRVVLRVGAPLACSPTAPPEACLAAVEAALGEVAGAPGPPEPPRHEP